MLSAAERLATELGEQKKQPRKPNTQNGSGPFTSANTVSTLDVLSWLGIAHEETPRGVMATCPGCGESGALVCKDGGLKCLHDRCAHVGPPKNRGFRTPVDLVAHVRQLEPVDAAREICRRFGIEGPKAKRSNGEPPAQPPDGRFDDERELPTADDPLRGLEHLAAVALVGRKRILDLAARPVSYVWQDIAAPGTICLLAGKSGDGKTTLLFLLLGARANLEAPIGLLGREIQPAPPGQFVVLIEGEHSESSAARKLVQSLQLLGVDDMALDRVIIIARKAVRLGSPEWSDVVRLVAAGLVSDIAIDTVARVAPGDADSEREQVAIFDGVAQAIEQAPPGVVPPSVWPVAHLRKGNGAGGLDEVSGSTQRVGQADSVLMLAAERVDGRVVSSRVTFAKLREDPDEWPESAEIIIARGPDGSRSLTTGAVTPEPADDRPLEDRILEVLAPGPKTKSNLAAALKRSKKDVDGAITTLFDARRLATTEVMVRGQPRKAFELRKDSNSARGPIRDSIRDSQSHGTDTGPNQDDSE